MSARLIVQTKEGEATFSFTLHRDQQGHFANIYDNDANDKLLTHSDHYIYPDAALIDAIEWVFGFIGANQLIVS